MSVGMLAGAGHSQQLAPARIAAVVNDTIISTSDINHRVGLLLFGSEAAGNDPAVIDRLRQQVLRRLIDETLVQQAAEVDGISVPDAQVHEALSMLAAQNDTNLTDLEGDLARRGIPIRVLREQTAATLRLQAMAQRRGRGQIRVRDAEVEEEIARLQDGVGEIEFELAQFVITIESGVTEADAHAEAERAVASIRAGERFSEVATRATGGLGETDGRLGWLLQQDIDPEIVEHVLALPTGSISEPIRTTYGFAVVGLAGKRVRGQADPEAARLQLSQLVIPAARIDSVGQLRSEIRSCPALEAFARQVGNRQSGPAGQFALRDLQPAIRARVEDLPLNQLSEPLRQGPALILIMVCAREEAAPPPLPEPDEVRHRLEATRIDRIAQRLLQDLRLGAFIDLRL
jgi:peptidyl-prolyl cis-trans isomerase SurA